MKASIIAAMMLIAGVASADDYRWLETQADLGAFAESAGKQQAAFRIVNTSDKPIRITGARATCGCTVPRYERNVIEPGDTAVLSVSYNPAGRPGRFSKKVFVDVDAAPRRSVLTISGVVEGSEATVAARHPVKAGPLRLTTAILPLGTVKSTASVSNYIEVYNVSTDTVRPTLEVSHPALHAMMVPAVIPPSQQSFVSLTYYGHQAPGYGLMTETVTLRPLGAEVAEGEIPLTITANVEEDFGELSAGDLAKAPQAVLLPGKLDYGTVVEGSAPVSVTLTLENRGEKPLLLRRAYSADDALSVTLPKDKKVKKGGSAALTVTLSPGAINPGSEVFSGVVTVITNDPSEPVQTVRAVAEVRGK